MSKLIAITVVVAGMTFGLGAAASAAGCDHAASAPAVTPSAQATAPRAYRSYSYQPSTPVYGSPAVRSRGYRSVPMFNSNRDAGAKIRGE